MGSAVDVLDRDGIHRSGLGAKILAACVREGINFTIVRIWAGGRKLERQLKNRHNHARLCPLCNPKLYHVTGDIDFYSELDELRAGTVKPVYSYSREDLERIEAEKIGEDIARQPFLY